MKLKLIFCLSLLMSLTACIKDTTNNANSVKDRIEHNVFMVFGTKFDKTHDWRTTTSEKFTVNVSDANVKKVQIIAYFQEDTVTSVKVLNEEEVSSVGNIELYCDVPFNTISVYAAQISDKGTTYEKLSPIFGKRALKRTAGVDYVLPNVELSIAGSINSYANERGWLPNEKLYYIDDYSSQKMSVADYDSEYKELFRAIVFSCFKNGRNYNNLPLVVNSGYYNENIYPITTGDEPIVVSPVYKNDGGYDEVVNSDLYYYYFKESDLGDDPVGYIESLPKYKALQFKDCIKGDDEICKHAAYALIYWGDETPTEGTQGTYQFPRGYKIGFMVRAMTEAENGKKQGELYGDGRLNNYINSYNKCNFKSSNLGTDGPRAAWMNINDKMLLCYESGTDADFNDIIIEVEGGIEPFNPFIEPEENSYTFCFEDTQFGDYDMNDLVIKAKRINSTKVEYRIVACGAHDKLYVKGINGNVINDKTDIHSMFGVKTEFINTVKGMPVHEPIVETITVNKTFSFLDEATQPYVYDATKNLEVKLSKEGEDPHGIMIPNDFKYPIERVCVKNAYDNFNSWGENKVLSTDWYKFPNEDKVY